MQDTDVYNGLLDSEGEGEGGTIWENGIFKGNSHHLLKKQESLQVRWSLKNDG